MQLSQVNVGETYAYIRDYPALRRRGWCSINKKPSFAARVIAKVKKPTEVVDSCGRKSKVNQTTLKVELFHIPPTHMYADDLDLSREDKSINVVETFISAKDLVCLWEDEVARAQDIARRERAYNQIVQFHRYLEFALAQVILRELDPEIYQLAQPPEWKNRIGSYSPYDSRLADFVQTPAHDYAARSHHGTAVPEFTFGGNWKFACLDPERGDQWIREVSYQQTWSSLALLAKKFKIRLPKEPVKSPREDRPGSSSTKAWDAWDSRMRKIALDVLGKFAALPWELRVTFFVEALNFAASEVWARFHINDVLSLSYPEFDFMVDWKGRADEMEKQLKALCWEIFDDQK